MITGRLIAIILVIATLIIIATLILVTTLIILTTLVVVFTRRSGLKRLHHHIIINVVRSVLRNRYTLTTTRNRTHRTVQLRVVRHSAIASCTISSLSFLLRLDHKLSLRVFHHNHFRLLFVAILILHSQHEAIIDRHQHSFLRRIQRNRHLRIQTQFSTNSGV